MHCYGRQARRDASGWNRGRGNLGKPATERKFFAMKFKPYLVTLLVAIVAVALVFRVTALRKAVTGATQ